MSRGDGGRLLVADRIYFIHAAQVGLIKIGISGDVRRRLRALRSASPVPLELLAHMPGSLDEERKLQATFWRHRAHGEWFVDSPRLRRYIADALTHPQEFS